MSHSRGTIQTCGISIGLLDCVGEQFCESEICQSPTLVGPGEACNTRDRLCPTGHDCRGVCVPKAGYDEACLRRTRTSIPDGGPATCREGICISRCRGISEFGDFCVDGRDCQVGYGCYGFQSGNTICTGEAAVKQELDEIFICP